MLAASVVNGLASLISAKRSRIFFFNQFPSRPSPFSRACPFSSHLCIIPDAAFSRTCPLRPFPVPSDLLSRPVPFPTFPPGPVPFLSICASSQTRSFPDLSPPTLSPLRPSPLPSVYDPSPTSFLPLRLSLRLSSGFSKPDRALSPCLDLSPSRTDLSPSRTFSPSLCHVVDVCR